MSIKSFKIEDSSTEINYYDFIGWKMIGLNADEIHIVLRNDEYFRLGGKTIRRDFLRAMKNKDYFLNNNFDCYYITKMINCTFCGGNGQIDWVSRAMQNSKTIHTLKYFSISKNRERECVLTNKGKSYATSLVPILSSDRIFIRTPVIRKGNEICSRCCGSSLAIGRFIKPIDKPSPFFDKIKGA